MPSFKGIKILGFKIFLTLIQVFKFKGARHKCRGGLNSFIFLTPKVHKFSLFLFKGYINNVSYATHYQLFFNSLQLRIFA